MSLFLLFLVFAGILAALAVIVIVLFQLRPNAQTHSDDEVFHSDSESDNPYASSNVGPQRRRQNAWILASVAVLACIACACPLSGIVAFRFLQAPMPAPRPVKATPAGGGLLEAVDEDDAERLERQ